MRAARDDGDLFAGARQLGGEQPADCPAPITQILIPRLQQRVPL